MYQFVWIIMTHLTSDATIREIRNRLTEDY